MARIASKVLLLLLHATTKQSQGCICLDVIPFNQGLTIADVMHRLLLVCASGILTAAGLTNIRPNGWCRSGDQICWKCRSRTPLILHQRLDTYVIFSTEEQMNRQKAPGNILMQKVCSCDMKPWVNDTALPYSHYR